MAKVDTNKVMQQAERSCVEHGVRLTSKRKHILKCCWTHKLHVQPMKLLTCIVRKPRKIFPSCRSIECWTF